MLRPVNHPRLALGTSAKMLALPLHVPNRSSEAPDGQVAYTRSSASANGSQISTSSSIKPPRRLTDANIEPVAEPHGLENLLPDADFNIGLRQQDPQWLG
jgi:hypothetical protein